MEGKGRFSARNWVFSDQTNPSHLASSVPEGNAPGYQPSFLKMSAYTNRSSIVNEPDNEASSMEFPWFPQRSFFSPTRDPSPEHTKKNKEIEAKPAKVRIATKALRPKEPKKPPAKKKGTSISTGKREKRNQDATIEGTTQDFSGVPAPVCTCTGVSRQCYRWGSGGWQSSCCTTTISEYPLPMSSSRPGARMAGRKMSIGAYAKLLQKLASEGRDLSYAVDLKDHWARHGTNKFVTIR